VVPGVSAGFNLFGGNNLDLDPAALQQVLELAGKFVGLAFGRFPMTISST